MPDREPYFGHGTRRDGMPGPEVVITDPHVAGFGTDTPAGYEHLSLEELLAAVEFVDASIDASAAPAYRKQPLAADWSRVTKVCEEAGEVWRALSNLTGENPRKGVCGTKEELLGELADTASASMCAIQHVTKDIAETWAVVSAAFARAASRVAEYEAPADEAVVADA